MTYVVCVYKVRKYWNFILFSRFTTLVFVYFTINYLFLNFLKRKSVFNTIFEKHLLIYCVITLQQIDVKSNFKTFLMICLHIFFKTILPFTRSK